MILVLSYDDSEQDPVTAYMIRQNISFVSLSLQELTEGRLRVMVDFNDDSLYIDGINLNEKVNVIWWEPLKYIAGCNGTATSCPFFGMRADAIEVLEFILYIFRDKIWLPNYVRLNKLKAFHVASGIDIRIPKSFLLTRKDDLRFFPNQLSVAIKPISCDELHVNRNKTGVPFNMRLSSEEFSYMEAEFQTSLFQHFIDAEYSYRLFYLDDEFYYQELASSGREGIWNNSKYTAIDLKDGQRFALTFSERCQLKKFMQKLEINICSMDFAYNNGEHYLRDIAPFGKHWLDPLYHMERRIADWLVAQDEIQNAKGIENPK